MADSALVKDVAKWSIVLGILMIVAGILAIALPALAGIAVNLLIAWLLILCGIAHLVFGLHRRNTGGVVWQLLLFLLYAGIGAYLLFRPLVGLAALTLVLAIFLLIEAVVEVALYIHFRRLRGAGWLLFGGVATFALSAMIWASWPFSSEWAIGTLLGISMLLSGLSRVMICIFSGRELAPGPG